MLSLLPLVLKLTNIWEEWKGSGHQVSIVTVKNIMEAFTIMTEN